MIYYIALLALYTGGMLYIRPAPQSFRDKPISFKENFYAIKGSLFLGILFLTVHLFMSDYTFVEPNEKLYSLFALNTLQSNENRIFQYVTHLFIHANIMHLVGNVIMIGVLSIYERRVGTKRFLMVFSLSGLVSGLSIHFYSSNISTIGISGAIFGIGAAFFTDEKDLTLKDWIIAVLLFVFLALFLSLGDMIEIKKLKYFDFQVNYIAHIIGASFAIIYTRMLPLK